MACRASIYMFFDPRNRLQPSILSQIIHISRYGPRPLFGMSNFRRKHKYRLNIKLWHMGTLFLCILTQEIDCNYQICIKSFTWPYYVPRPLFGVIGTLSENKQIVQIWNYGILELYPYGFETWNIDCSYQICIKSFTWADYVPHPLHGVAGTLHKLIKIVQMLRIAIYPISYDLI